MTEHSRKDPAEDPTAARPPAAAPHDEAPEKAEVEAYTQTSPSDIKQYIEAAAEATERSRRVLIILITASVLALVATWNSRPASWFNERYRVINAAGMLFDEQNQRRPLDHPEILKLRQGDSTRLYERADEFVDYWKITDRAVVKDIAQRLAAQRVEHVTTVRMPFFGVGFDVNDIGIFAGFTFAVVLLWFRFSLLREVNNLRLAFYEARNQDRAKARAGGEAEGGEHEQLRFCYDMLAMRQVLTTPEMKPQEDRTTIFSRTRRLFWIMTSKVLFLLPMAVQLFVMRNDRNSVRVGLMISPHNTELVLEASRAFLIAIIILTGLCFLLVYRAHRTWKEAAGELKLT